MLIPALIAVLLFALHSGYQMLMDHPIWDPERGGLYVSSRAALGLAATIGYVLAAIGWVSHTVRRELKAFGVEIEDPVLAELDLAQNDFSASAVATSRYVGMAAVAIVALGHVAADAFIDMGWAAGFWANFALGVLLVWIAARAGIP